MLSRCCCFCFRFSFNLFFDVMSFQALVVVVLPDPFRGMGARRNSVETQQSNHTQGLDHRSRIEKEEPKIDLRRGSEAGQSRRRWLRSCRGCPQALQTEFSFRLILWKYEDKRRLWPWQRRRESSHRAAPASCRLIVVQSPPQWGWVEMAGQISREARPKGRPHCLFRLSPALSSCSIHQKKKFTNTTDEIAHLFHLKL